MDALLNPTTVVIIGALMFVELYVLTRLFSKRNDQQNVIITYGNVFAGVFLMAAVASEMSEQATWVTGACLFGALISHTVEIYSRVVGTKK